MKKKDYKHFTKSHLYNLIDKHYEELDKITEELKQRIQNKITKEMIQWTNKKSSMKR